MKILFSFLIALAMTLSPFSTAANNNEGVQQSANHDSVVVKGTVLDNTGEPIVGATVMEKGSNNGTATGLDGTFSIRLKGKNPVILVSFIGMSPMTVKITDNKLLTLRMEPTSSSLDEVVVTGYQTISKERTTGAFSTVNAEQLRQTQRIASVDNLLEGHVAGYADGKLRGTTTLEGETSPLYVIDGFPIEKNSYDGYGWNETVPDLNVEDIESITVLKDAAATSIYGARAANGVIVITTKKGGKGKVDVSFSANVTFQPYKTYNGRFLDSEGIVALEREQFNQLSQSWNEMAEMYGLPGSYFAQSYYDDNAYPSPVMKSLLGAMVGEISQEEADKRIAGYAKQGYKYAEDVDKYGKQDPVYQQYNLRIGSTTDRNSFNASLSYRHNREADKYTKNQQLGITLQNTLKLTNWLSIDLGAYINYNNSNRQTYSLDGIALGSYTMWPYMSLMDGENPVTIKSSEYMSASQVNTLNRYNLYSMDVTPLDETAMNIAKTKNRSTRTYARLNFKITDWLRFHTQFQYESGTSENNRLYEQESYYVRNLVNRKITRDADGKLVENIPYGDIYNKAMTNIQAYNLRAQLDFNKRFNDRHDVTAIVGFELRENKNEYNSNVYYNYDDKLLTYSLINQKDINGISGLLGGYSLPSFASFVESTNRFISFYGNLAYTFDDKYMLTGSIRWDRTNLFATSSRFQKKPIWSVGLAWRLDKEDFFNVEWIDMLKPRFSYGIGGNVPKKNSPYMTLSYGDNNYLNHPSASVASRPNMNLRWEKTTTTNVGLEFSMFSNRLNGSIEYYYKNSDDLLTDVTGVPVEGWSGETYAVNNGRMTNKGFEISLNGIAYADKDWVVSLGGTFGYNKNKIKRVDRYAPTLRSKLLTPRAYPTEGYPLDAMFTYKYAGVSETGAPQIYDENGEIVSGVQLTSMDALYYAGSSLPIWNGSFSPSVRWKDFELSAMLMFEGGNKIRLMYIPFCYYGSLSTHMAKEIVDAWKQPGDEQKTDIPRVNFNLVDMAGMNDSDNYYYSDANIYDAWNVSLRSISLSYNLPSKIASKLYMKDVRFMVGMENVFTIATNSKVKYELGGYNRPHYTFGVSVNF